MSSIISRYGGKHLLTKKIVNEILKIDFQAFIEVFCGAGHISFALQKEKDCQIILNDKDKMVVNFFKVLQDKKSRIALYQKLKYTPYSRKIFNECTYILKNNNTDNIEFAYAFYVVNKMSIGGMVGKGQSSFGFAIGDRNRQKTLNNSIKDISYYANILKKFIIEFRDFREIIEKFNDERVLLYCDPPYLGSDLGGYVLEWHENDFVDLCRMLKETKANVILSMQEHKILREELKDWHFIEVERINVVNIKKVKKDRIKEFIILKPNNIKKYNNYHGDGLFGGI